MNIARKFNLISAPLLALSLALTAPVYADKDKSVKQQLETSIAGSWRSEKNKARDQYRHPLETLTFFGITPKAKVIELFPGGSTWYTEILAPFLKDSGQLTVVNFKSEKEDNSQKDKFAADPARYGKVKVVEISKTNMSFGEPGSADFFLTFRNVHNFAMQGTHSQLFAEIYKVLKPGGVLGIEDHRAAEGKTFEEVKMSGYLPEEFVIAEAEKAGFKLDARSPVNNNAKDTKNYPKGVWTLPPVLREGDTDKDKYLAIGESDRFTLRFVKPKK
ncbi:methyltransferase [Cellvibrio zantedeschiae]|uniref:Methyltransferase n=1 Tax=Cellvibrio zantedeschiae TaxID=1237077 RepID=A0ABQ3AXB8_9GAMM|nr:methyltransferase domain-containing protein [Cellvibrio zantedeschiae]GGY69555.1 methyltransferase [Cellvibrio zantedeschiae]